MSFVEESVWRGSVINLDVEGCDGKGQGRDNKMWCK